MAAVDEWLKMPHADRYSSYEKSMAGSLAKMVDEMLAKDFKPVVDEAKKKIHAQVLALC